MVTSFRKYELQTLIVGICLMFTIPALGEAPRQLRALEKFLDMHPSEVQVCPMCIKSKPIYKAVADLGPNVLSDLYVVYTKEQNPLNSSIYSNLICDISKFRFIYLDTNETTNTVLTAPDFTLAINKSEEQIPLKEKSQLEKSKLISMWNQCKAGLNGKAIVGLKQRKTQMNDSQPLEKRRASSFVRYQSFGIFNLPELIELVQKDNDNLAFLEFLRVSGNSVYSCQTGEWSKCADQIGLRYPNTQDKMNVVREWWTQNHSRFTEVAGLYNRINEAMK